MKLINTSLSICLFTVTSLSALAATWGSNDQEKSSTTSSNYWSTTTLKSTAEIERINDEIHYNNMLNQHWRLFPGNNYNRPSYGPSYNDGAYRPGFRIPLLQPVESCVKRHEMGVEIAAGDCVVTEPQ